MRGAVTGTRRSLASLEESLDRDADLRRKAGQIHRPPTLEMRAAKTGEPAKLLNLELAHFRNLVAERSMIDATAPQTSSQHR